MTSNTPGDGSPSGDNMHDTTPLHEIVDDTVNIGAPGAGWDQEEYIDRNGKKRIRLTRM
jgi:hypothetical protein